MLKIAYLSTYVPKKCGIATYTHHLRISIRQAMNPANVRDQVIVVQSPDETRDIYQKSLWFLQRDLPSDYQKMAWQVNNSPVDLVSLQHEFGIFGGNAGEYVLEFARLLKKPLVTTFHTVFPHPQSPYREIQQELVHRSAHIIVMNRRAVKYLAEAYNTNPKKISYIPHGTPVPVMEPKEKLKSVFGWNGRKVVLTFGLLGPSKGIEVILDALPSVVKRVPNLLYVIAGETHPEIVKREGEAYRQRLSKMIQKHKLENHVIMLNRYMQDSEIRKLISACDLYVTPYPGMEQITSGTLAYAVGTGCCVLSTPYAYARDLLRELEGLLIPYEKVNEWAFKMIRLLENDNLRLSYASKILRIGRRMQWPEVGFKHWNLFCALAGIQEGPEQRRASLVSR